MSEDEDDEVGRADVLLEEAFAVFSRKTLVEDDDDDDEAAVVVAAAAAVGLLSLVHPPNPTFLR